MNYRTSIKNIHYKKTSVNLKKNKKQPTQSRSVDQRITLLKISLQCILNVDI